VEMRFASFLQVDRKIHTVKRNFKDHRLMRQIGGLRIQTLKSFYIFNS